MCWRQTRFPLLFPHTHTPHTTHARAHHTRTCTHTRTFAASVPVAATMRRIPLATASSEMMVNLPMSAEFFTCLRDPAKSTGHEFRNGMQPQSTHNSHTHTHARARQHLPPHPNNHSPRNGFQNPRTCHAQSGPPKLTCHRRTRPSGRRRGCRPGPQQPQQCPRQQRARARGQGTSRQTWRAAR